MAISFQGFLVGILICYPNVTFFAQTDEEVNHAPVIEIVTPNSDMVLHANSLVPYSISVNDVEDGNSAYEEIENQEVFLITKYLSSSAQADDYLADIEKNLAPLIKMGRSTCLTCHTANSKLIGPSFDLLARKYRTSENAMDILSENVIVGSTGVWGEEKMPPHPDLTEEEVRLMIDWILRQEDEATQFVVGLEGAIRVRETPTHIDSGVYVLTAVYQDHGSIATAKDQELGLQSIALKVQH